MRVAMRPMTSSNSLSAGCSDGYNARRRMRGGVERRSSRMSFPRRISSAIANAGNNPSAAVSDTTVRFTPSTLPADSMRGRLPGACRIPLHEIAIFKKRRAHDSGYGASSCVNGCPRRDAKCCKHR